MGAGPQASSGPAQPKPLVLSRAIADESVDATIAERELVDAVPCDRVTFDRSGFAREDDAMVIVGGDVQNVDPQVSLVDVHHLAEELRHVGLAPIGAGNCQ